MGGRISASERCKQNDNGHLHQILKNKNKSQLMEKWCC